MSTDDPGSSGDPLIIDNNTPLAPHTSWLVGGAAEFFCQPVNIGQFKEAQKFAQKKGLSQTILSGGSNVLISDSGVNGLTIGMQKFTAIQVSESPQKVEIIAAAGAGKSELLRMFLKYKLAPALFLAGIPGDVGGGVVMNAGVAEHFCPREFVEITDWIEVLKPDGSIKKLSKSELHWEYRHSSGWQPGIILRVGISWKNQPDNLILVQVKEANRLRLSKQPLDMPSCGSVFVNPLSHKAAALIDSCGLKGYTQGQAQVSQKHANFIVNLGKASAQEIWAVIQHVQKTVHEKTGVKLTTEVVRLGQWPG